MSEAYWKERAERLEAALQEASELIHDLIDSGDGEVARVQRLVRTELAPQSEATEEVPECPECHVAADRPGCAFGFGDCPRPRLYGRTKRTQKPQDEADESCGDHYGNS